jgi:Flp pilus assembly protein TadD
VTILSSALACFALGIATGRRDEETPSARSLLAGAARGGSTSATSSGPRRAREAQYAEGARREPEDVGLLLNLGIARMRLGHLGDAEKALGRATEIAPGDARTWATLGALHGNAGRPDEARRAFERALAIDPGHADARRGMIILNGAQE